eukprot:CAMPEP_0194549092 /NCGR_PEP_ID=MMETSP0253-20130528/94684_1 /TAXON_ID=2966 /ORGANISM="Noctiluca scintillans" /LENGTH=53 /DNA_ID=CAMNT_0039396483 /DNA_START=78 /DNA_END=236 /DNA_ORIENTATION=+
MQLWKEVHHALEVYELGICAFLWVHGGQTVRTRQRYEPVEVRGTRDVERMGES